MMLILIHDHSFGGFETTFEQLNKKTAVRSDSVRRYSS